MRIAVRPSIIRIAAALWLVGCSSGPTSQTSVPILSNEPLGETKSSAIEVCMPEGERAYLSRLVCANGANPTFKRNGNVGPRYDFPRRLTAAQEEKLLQQAMGEPLKAGDVDYHFIDVYTVNCEQGEFQLYFDMYHCNKAGPMTAPNGFSLGAAR